MCFFNVCVYVYVPVWVHMQGMSEDHIGCHFPDTFHLLFGLKLHQEGQGNWPVKCGNPPASSSFQLIVITKITHVSMGSGDWIRSSCLQSKHLTDRAISLAQEWISNTGYAPLIWKSGGETRKPQELKTFGVLMWSHKRKIPDHKTSFHAPKCGKCCLKLMSICVHRCICYVKECMYQLVSHAKDS